MNVVPIEAHEIDRSSAQRLENSPPRDERRGHIEVAGVLHLEVADLNLTLEAHRADVAIGMSVGLDPRPRFHAPVKGDEWLCGAAVRRPLDSDERAGSEALAAVAPRRLRRITELHRVLGQGLQVDVLPRGRGVRHESPRRGKDLGQELVEGERVRGRKAGVGRDGQEAKRGKGGRRGRQETPSFKKHPGLDANFASQRQLIRGFVDHRSPPGIYLGFGTSRAVSSRTRAIRLSTG